MKQKKQTSISYNDRYSDKRKKSFIGSLIAGSLISALISAAASVGSSAIQAKEQRNAIRKQNQDNAETAANQQAQNLQNNINNQSAIKSSQSRVTLKLGGNGKGIKARRMSDNNINNSNVYIDRDLFKCGGKRKLGGKSKC